MARWRSKVSQSTDCRALHRPLAIRCKHRQESVRIGDVVDWWLVHDPFPSGARIALTCLSSWSFARRSGVPGYLDQFFQVRGHLLTRLTVLAVHADKSKFVEHITQGEAKV
jgi:hypothetical protein